MPDTSVKIYQSTDTGMPSITGLAGGILSALDLLVYGSSTLTVSTLVVYNDVATVTVSAGHGLTMIGTIGPVVTIAGATPAGLNGEWRLASIPNSTTCTFATSGIPNQTATGTITVKRAGAGWTKPYSGTNKAVYQNAGTGFCLRVDDSATGAAKVRGYESMTDVDTGVDPFPTVAQMASLYWMKSTVADGTARPWWIAADDKAFWLFVANNPSYPSSYGVFYFGDYNRIYPVDAYACAIFGSDSSANSGQGYNEATSVQAGHFIARSQDGLSKSLQFFKTRGGYAGTQPGWMGSTVYSTTTGLAPTVATPLLIVTTENSNTMPRGILPGVFSVHRHPLSGTQGDMISDGNSLLMLGRGANNNNSPSYTGLAAVKMDGWR